MRGDTMKKGKILRWIKHEGDAVKKGESLAEVETDKVNIEIEAFASGVLRKILVPEGKSAPIGSGIALIGAADEPLPEGLSGGANNAGTAGRIFISPLARRFAEERSIDYSQIRGTGPNGRIIKLDVEAALAQPAMGTRAA